MPPHDRLLEAGRGEHRPGQPAPVRPGHGPSTGGENDQCGQGADYEGVDESAEHGDDALTNRAVGLRRCVGDGRGSEAGLVREHAAGHPETDGCGYGRSCEPASGCSRSEGVSKDEPDRRGDFGDIDGNDEQCRPEVQHDHGGYQFPGNVANPADAPNDDHTDESGNDNSGQPLGHAETVPKCHGHRVHLDRVANAERSERTKDGECKSKVLAEFRSKFPDAVAQVVHRTADILAVGVDLPVGDRADGFRVLRCHPEQGDEPHVEDGPRATEGDGGRHTGDVAGSHRGGQRGHQCVERLDFTFARHLILVEQQPEPVANLAPWHEHEPKRQQQPGHSKNTQHGRSPCERIDGIDD